MDDSTRLDDLIQAYLNGTSSAQDLADLQAELQASPAAAEAFADATRLHVALSTELREARQIESVTEGFAAAEKSARSPAFRRQNVELPTSVRLNPRHRTRWLAAAALMVAAVGAGIFWNWKTAAPSPAVVSGTVLVDGKSGAQIRAGAIIATEGPEPATLRLADRSTMVLNPSSEATLNGAQNGFREVVALHKGSAHFTVNKGGGKFIVNTSAGNVTVFGTEFDMELRPAASGEQTVGRKAAWVLAVAVFAGTVNVDFDGQTYQLAVGDNRVFGEEQIAHAGDAGSYRLTRPQPCKALPEKIHKTENVKGPPITHQWWSSLLWQQKKFGQPLFAHPFVATCSEGGLAIAYPGAAIKGNNSGIFGGGAGKDGDLKIGHSGGPFQQVDCDGYSDWFVSALFANGPATLRASIGHGSPFVYCTYNGGHPTVSFTVPPQVWAGTEKDAVLGVTAGGHNYALFGATGSHWSGLGTKLLSNEGEKNYFSVALLPDNRPETLALFRKVAYNHVSDTKVEYKIDGGVVKSAYRFGFKA